MNNPLMYNDLSGEIFFFAALAPIIGKIAAGIVAGAIAGAIVGVATYMITNQWSWRSFGSSVLMGALAGAVTGGYNPGVFTSVSGTLLNMAGQMVSSVLPSWEINIGDFSFNISPSIP